MLPFKAKTMSTDHRSFQTLAHLLITELPLLLIILQVLLSQASGAAQIISHRTVRNIDTEDNPNDALNRDIRSLNHSERRPVFNKKIPMEFYKELDNVSDISEFIERFVKKDSIDPKLGIQDNFRRSVERASAIIPKPASCIPENTIVPLTPLNPSNDPKVIYYPKCTRVKRCNGCCSSELMACQPIETELLNFEVTKYRYGEKTPLRGKEIIVVEQHTKCRCGCRIKEEDCNSYQVYHPELCRCVCTNEDALQKCLSQEHKIWDEQACRCVCRDSQSCTTGTIFDESQCKCIDQIAAPSLLDRRRFILKAIPVDPDNGTIYDT